MLFTADMRLFAHIHHHNPSPWDDAPAWAHELRGMLSVIIDNQETIMAAIDDLKTAIAALIAEATADIAAHVAQINTQTNNDPAIVALTQKVTDATTALHASFTTATGTPVAPAA